MSGSRPPLIDCEWLNAYLGNSDIIILDAGFFLPRQLRNAYAEYQQAHIPGARFFDIDLIADLSSNLPHTLPCADEFAAAVGSMGIGDHTRVIIYDNNTFFASARAWWMFRVFGHNNVFVLDGGFRRWNLLGLPVNTRITVQEQQVFTAVYQDNLVCDLNQMRQIQLSGVHQILDSRSPDSYAGERQTNDFNLRSGHIPGSINIPYRKLSNAVDHTLLSCKELKTLFTKHSVNFNRPVVTTCGSGVSAAVLALSLYCSGLTDVPAYDGSWAEWGRQKDTPVA